MIIVTIDATPSPHPLPFRECHHAAYLLPPPDEFKSRMVVEAIWNVQEAVFFQRTTHQLSALCRRPGAVGARTHLRVKPRPGCQAHPLDSRPSLPYILLSKPISYGSR
nr:unnamed protein product [Spirometra erinaceieuropaei]